jgi:hypothetical protein
VNPNLRLIFLQLTLLIPISVLTSTQAWSQNGLSIKPEEVRLIRQAIDSIYNMNFAAADPVIKKLDERIPDYPGVTLLKAFYYNWKHKPIKTGSMPFEKFEYYLGQTIELAAKRLDEDDEDVEGIFFSLSANSFLAQLYADNQLTMKALGAAKNSYGYVKEGFDLIEEFPEFYFPCGIYNYYRERYPEEHPFYKPFLWIFRSGDKAEGLRMLKLGAEKGIFTKAESLTYLYHIYLHYERKPEVGMEYIQKLHRQYPGNLTYTFLLVENMLYLNQYKSAYAHIEDLLYSSNDFYRYTGYIFDGWYQEKYKNDAEAARRAYEHAVTLSEASNVGTLHHESLLYLGLGRVYESLNMKDEAKESYKTSVKMAEYSHIRDAAAEGAAGL